MARPSLSLGERYCSVLNCSNVIRQTGETSFFRFPRNPVLCRKWVTFCKRPDLEDRKPEYLYKRHRICSDHFEDECFLNGFKNRRISNAVPTLCSPFNSSSSIKSKKRPQKRRAVVYGPKSAAKKRKYASDDDADADADAGTYLLDSSGPVEEFAESESITDLYMTHPEISTGVSQNETEASPEPVMLECNEQAEVASINFSPTAEEQSFAEEGEEDPLMPSTSDSHEDTQITEITALQEDYESESARTYHHTMFGGFCKEHCAQVSKLDEELHRQKMIYESLRLENEKRLHCLREQILMAELKATHVTLRIEQLKEQQLVAKITRKI